MQCSRLTIQIGADVMKKQIKRCCMLFASPSGICIEFLYFGLNWQLKAFGKI
jgi:hypothetical protein